MVIYTAWCALMFTIMCLITAPFFLVFPFVFRKDALGPLILLCKAVAYGFSFTTGIFYRLHNRKLIDKKRTYIFIANHRSNLDAPVAAAAVWGRIKPVAKKELLKVPVLGFIFKQTSIIVDRSSKASRLQTLEQIKQTVDSGAHVLVFPEGTRNKTEQDMIDFKDGAFSMAIQTQTPLLPVLLLNTDVLLPNKKPLMQPGICEVYYLPVVEVNGLTDADIPALKERVRSIMLENYKLLKTKHGIQ
ncbi:MAG: lysophospholipid acyltransferase family protein [Chitinophagales bacterium]